MYPVSSPYPGGTIGIPCATVPRYLDFEHSLEGLKIPNNCLSLRLPGSNVTLNMEGIVRQMQGEWLWIIGDDHTFDPELLLNLLKHDVDVVVPLCARRGPPFWPVVYKNLDIPAGVCDVYEWYELSLMDGLISVEGVGSAGMLIKKRVLDALPLPIFENLLTADGKAAGEDVSLSYKIIKAGFPIHVDLNQVMGHVTPVDIRPVRGYDGVFRTDGIFGRRTTPEGERDLNVRLTWSGSQEAHQMAAAGPSRLEETLHGYDTRPVLLPSLRDVCS